jgi:hypothetical protein
MSRVTYSEIHATADQEALRAAHQVRLVAEAEEGTGIDRLPGGVYGFTYAPGLPGGPLFALPRFRSYETHKLPSGEVFVIGFASPEHARALSTAEREVTVRIHPEPKPGCDRLVTIPYSRICHHKQYSAPNQDGLTVTVR